MKDLPQKKVSCVVPRHWNLSCMGFPASLHISIYYEDESCLKNVVIFNSTSS